MGGSPKGLATTVATEMIWFIQGCPTSPHKEKCHTTWTFPVSIRADERLLCVTYSGKFLLTETKKLVPRGVNLNCWISSWTQQQVVTLTVYWSNSGTSDAVCKSINV
jgi:hypothetical protein